MLELCNYQVMQTRQRRHSCWVRGYLLQRSEYGAYNCLMRDLGIPDADKLKNYVRMDKAAFDILFALVEPLSTKKINSISVQTRVESPRAEKKVREAIYKESYDRYPS